MFAPSLFKHYPSGPCAQQLLGTWDVCASNGGTGVGKVQYVVIWRFDTQDKPVDL